ncbi:unnamed protein product [Litomosoides sigmodontis]|uniref:Alpha-1,3-glucosyltransferase n=1 Tax=Litomosoides sigmodontis TaxID=42156 RepID=A0A3P6TTB3_LITSI|nr:unnamed protein product [Litomosoides sigmodontis]
MITTHLSVSEDQVNDPKLLGYLRQFREEWFQYCCAAVFAIKFLLVPCYRSTDFEVASKIMPSALVLQRDPYFSIDFLYFQRFSVIATDVFYILSCVFLALSFSAHCKNYSDVQKNSAAVGILLIANVSLGALTFCILLNMKHIYLYYAPAYVVYYAVNYLFSSAKAFITNGAKLALVIILPFALSFGPLIYLCGPDIIQQIWRRLFPFERGLTHAYWAPNIWAFYNFVDWYFYQMLKLTKRLPPKVQPPSYISGLVQEFKHSILPSVSPFVTLVLTSALLLPLVSLIRTRYSKNFSLLLTLSAFAFFLAGYHVHEKAVILITVPYTVLASSDHRFLPSFVVLSFVANVSLFPLFFTSFENILKVSITFCYLFLSISIMRFLCPESSLRFLQKLYLFGLVMVQYLSFNGTSLDFVAYGF